MIILLKKFFRSAIIYNMKFKGAIFDLDGTLLDSMHVWDKVDEEYFALLGKPVPAGYVLAIRDLTMLQAAEYTKRITGVADSAEEICAKWREMVADHYAEQVQPKRGAVEFLRFLHGRGVKLGIATTLTEETYLPALERLGIEDMFSAKVSVRDVGRGKGFPDVYLRAAHTMGLEADECAVFEDILKGITSAKSAGFTVVGVYDESSAADEGAARRTAALYVYDFTSEELKDMFGGRR